MTYWRLFYHLVWGTKSREPLIDDDRAVVIERSIRVVCHEAGVILHAIGGMPDHRHLAVSIPPRLAIAEFMRRAKGESSHLLNHSAGREGGDWFAWQPEYGAISFGEGPLPRVIAYIQNQAEHHASNTLWPSFELTDRPRPSGDTNSNSSF
jgi:putative transposase